MAEWAQPVAVWFGLTILLAASVHLAVILAIPWAVGRYLRSMGEPNVIVHADRPSANNNRIRRASPDLIYSLGSYDLSNGPLHVVAPTASTYTSVSCFASNTDNFYVKNDRQVTQCFDFFLVGPRTRAPKVPGMDIVRSPTATGGILFRYFVGDGKQVEEIECLRRQIRLESFREPAQDEHVDL